MNILEVDGYDPWFTTLASPVSQPSTEPNSGALRNTSSIFPHDPLRGLSGSGYQRFTDSTIFSDFLNIFLLALHRLVSPRTEGIGTGKLRPYIKVAVFYADRRS
jgi:hypothetical protein